MPRGSQPGLGDSPTGRHDSVQKVRGRWSMRIGGVKVRFPPLKGMSSLCGPLTLEPTPRSGSLAGLVRAIQGRYGHGP